LQALTTITPGTVRKVAIILILILGVYPAFNFSAKLRSSPNTPTTNGVSVDTISTSYVRLFNSIDSLYRLKSALNGFSGSVMVAVKGKPVYTANFGYSDYSTRTPVSDTSSFQLASVSKTFTATAVLYLAQQGKLSLDDTIQKFFPGMPYKGVTVKQLLCHRSGLPNYLYFCTGSLIDRTKYLSNQNVIDLMVKTRPAANNRPNKVFEYSNTNYVLLASIVEVVTGMRFQEFMQTTFFEPLGMDHTFVYDFTDHTNHSIAISYNAKWQPQFDDCFDGVVGDKGVYSTTADMLKWDQAFYNYTFLNQEMVEEAYAPRSFENGGFKSYGYGWRMTKQQDGNYLIYHNGWWHGNNTVFCRNVNENATIIVLSNHFNKGVYYVQPVWDLVHGTITNTPEQIDEPALGGE
jgi:CubicO group peptidase (beta-lactamase class C family)